VTGWLNPVKPIAPGKHLTTNIMSQFLDKVQLLLTNLRDALHHGKRKI